MSTDVWLAEMAAAIGTNEGTLDSSCACVVGVEAVTRERWRVWFQPYSTSGTILFLVTLRSNHAGRSFDVQVALNIACWCPLPGDTSSMLTSVQQLVREFDHLRGLFDRIGQRGYREIQVAAVPLPFSDPWDRLWVSWDAAQVRQVPQRAETLLVWQHGDALFLVTGWNSVIVTALLSRGPRLPPDRSSPEEGHTTKTPAAHRSTQRKI